MKQHEIKLAVILCHGHYIGSNKFQKSIFLDKKGFFYAFVSLNIDSYMFEMVLMSIILKKLHISLYVMIGRLVTSLVLQVFITV